MTAESKSEPTAPETPDLAVRRDQWCRRVLGNSAPEAPPAMRKGMYRRLRQEDFLVSEAWEGAARILLHQPAWRGDTKVSPTNGPTSFLLDEERRLLDQVGSLAEKFFSLPWQVRRERWRAMVMTAQGFPRVLARLAALKKGLTLKPPIPPPNDERIERLMEMIQTLFCLSPVEQAKRRHAFFQSIKDDPIAWSQAANRLQKRYPERAALMPDFVAQVLRRNPAMPVYAPPPPSVSAPAPTKIVSAPRSDAETWGDYSLRDMEMSWSKLGVIFFLLACGVLAYLETSFVWKSWKEPAAKQSSPAPFQVPATNYNSYPASGNYNSLPSGARIPPMSPNPNIPRPKMPSPNMGRSSSPRPYIPGPRPGVPSSRPVIPRPGAPRPNFGRGMRPNLGNPPDATEINRVIRETEEAIPQWEIPLEGDPRQGLLEIPDPAAASEVFLRESRP